MHVHILQHVSFEDIGSMAPWLAARGAALHYTRFHEPAADLPNIHGIDLIIAMGGPMSVNDEQQFPWLKEEKRFIRAAVQQGVPFIGICLGAQILASAFGARVYPNREREIGWFPIEPIPPVAAALIGVCRHELTGGGAYVQSEAALTTTRPEAFERINRLMADVLAYVTRG